MNFRPELAAKVLAGEKTVTRRLTSDNPRSPWWREKCGVRAGGGPGGSYAVCPGRSKPAVGRMVVTGVRLEALMWLDDEEAKREGFASAAEFVEAFEAINGSYDADALVWRIEFEAAAA